MNRKTGDDLQKHMLGTYFSLRVGLAAIGALLPVVVLLAGGWNCGVWSEKSLSAYYHTAEKVTCHTPTFTPRDLFVGGLFALAACLYLYKGYTTRENVALNLAGVFAALVAVVPTSDDRWEHKVAAALFFVCGAYVSLWCSGSTIDLLPEGRRPLYRRLYRLTGVLMIFLPLAALTLDYLRMQPADSFMRTPLAQAHPPIFWAETMAFWAFAAYWSVKTREMHHTGTEKRAVQAELHAPDVRPAAPVNRARETAGSGAA